ncbi:hypothetical protein DFJ77DRAFT_531529 [Powellomyces hirtus]|nr:hypothetical protein DFJ77DRAFT_531529 [Powellomyces hirtus]
MFRPPSVANTTSGTSTSIGPGWNKPRPASASDKENAKARPAAVHPGTEKGKAVKSQGLEGSRIPLRSTTTKSSVKPVPDFSKLHQKWESKISNSKSCLRRDVNATKPMIRPGSSNSNNSNGSIGITDKNPTSEKATHATAAATSTLRKATAPNIRPALPPTVTSTVAPSRPTTSSISGLVKTGLKGPVRTPARKKPQTALPRPPVVDEFNNEALNDILNSGDSNELDTRRATGAFRTPAKRLTMNPARRVTTAPRRATVILQEQQPGDEEQLKRRSMYAGAVRVARRKPVHATLPDDQTSSTTHHPPDSNHTHHSNIPDHDLSVSHALRTPNKASAARHLSALTPRERQHKKIAHTMGLLVAETFGTPRAQMETSSRTPRAMGSSFRHRMEAEGLRGDDDTLVKGMQSLEHLVDEVHDDIERKAAERNGRIMAKLGGRDIPADGSAQSPFNTGAASAQAPFTTVADAPRPNIGMPQHREPTSQPIPSLVQPPAAPTSQLPPISALLTGASIAGPIGLSTSLASVPLLDPGFPNPFHPSSSQLSQNHHTGLPDRTDDHDTTVDQNAMPTILSLSHLLSPSKSAPSVNTNLIPPVTTTVQKIEPGKNDDSWRDVVGIPSAPKTSQLETKAMAPAAEPNHLATPAITPANSLHYDAVPLYSTTDAQHQQPPQNQRRRRRSSARRRSSVSSNGSAKIRRELSLLALQEAELQRRLEEMRNQETDSECDFSDDSEWSSEDAEGADGNVVDSTSRDENTTQV